MCSSRNVSNDTPIVSKKSSNKSPQGSKAIVVSGRAFAGAEAGLFRWRGSVSSWLWLEGVELELDTNEVMSAMWIHNLPVYE